MLGDLSLCGFPIKAQILAARPGHASNIEFVKKIRALYKKKLPLKKFTEIKSGEPALNINALLDIMPHRYPFLMIDRILEVDMEKKKIVGLKNVTYNEPYFIGHFPEKPIMPGVLQIEAMAQTGCLLIALADEDFRKKLVFFLGIKNAKFRKTVVPGDQLIIEVEMTAKKLNASWFKAVSYVNNQVVAESEFQAIIVDRKSQ
jgi:UDP-3-O-[3-hydroxymyristoyl] N-acetylglucosamine deacetylase/3-hydroxyacyl-[acyl-carrier-protein] dehydratase